jgi:Na+-driven multidrug efflux pump
VARITRAGIIVNVLLTGGMVVLLTVFERPIIGLFLGGDSPALPIAARIQLLATWGFVLFGMTMVLFGTVRANGAVWGPLAILFVAMYPIRIGFALGLRPLLGADALWWSFPAGSTVTVLLAGLYYLYGPWRRGGVLIPPGTHECEEQAQATIEPAGMVKPAG